MYGSEIDFFIFEEFVNIFKFFCKIYDIVLCWDNDFSVFILFFYVIFVFVYYFMFYLEVICYVV